MHVKGEDFPDVIIRLKQLLKPGGIFYASFKEGNTEREKDGRFFHDMTEETCKQLFHDSGLLIMEAFRSQDVREDHAGDTWKNVIGKKN